MPSKYLSLALVLALHGLSSNAGAGILLNEVHIDPSGTDSDSNLEYIELVSTTGAAESTNGLTLLLIDSNNGGYGKIRKRWSLNGLSTGSNGLLVLGNLYPTSFPYGPVPPGTNTGDPAGTDSFDNGDIGSNGGLTLFLVAGFIGSTPLDYDLDNNDDGRLDLSRWTTLLDSIGFNDTDPLDPPNRSTYALANLSQATFFPENVSRKLGNTTPNSVDAWFGGSIPSSSPNGLLFNPEKTFSGFPGAGATPGLQNQPPAAADLRLNEISINPNGNDENLEFIEIASLDGDRVRTDSYHILLVINDPLQGNVGTIEQAWDLSGLQTGDNGLLIIGDAYAKPFLEKRADTPFKTLVELQTEAGDPQSFGRNEIEPSDGVSILLVTGFTGSSGIDLDSNNDGILDSMPWDSLVDSVGFDNTNPTTGSKSKTYAPGRLNISGFYPDNVSRIAGNQTANSGDAWYGGDYGGDSQSSIGFNELTFSPAAVTIQKMRATPGGANLSAGSAPYERNVLINEVLVDAPGNPGNSDDNTHEFIELVSVNQRVEILEGLSLLIVDTAPGSNQNGIVRQVFNLSGLSTGSNGLCVIGDSYNDILTFAPVPFDTNREDPQAFNAGDLTPNDGLTVLLVEDFSGTNNQDIDTDNDGTFDISPWGKLIDAVGYGMVTDPAVANLNQSGYLPDTFARLPSSLDSAQPTLASAWAGGTLEGSPFETRYGSQYFGPFRGGFTRGFANHSATPVEAGAVRINEVIVKPADESQRHECIELIVTSLDARSLSGYSLVQLDSNGSSVGAITHIWDLSGMATGDNGLLLIGDNFNQSVPFPIDPQTASASPIGFKSGDIGDDSAFSLLLVKGLMPTVNEGTDLDISANGNLNDDGVLDDTPWAEIVDSVGFREFDSDLSSLTGITYASANLSQNYNPDVMARLGSGNRLNAHSAGDWFGGDFGNSGFALDSQQRFGSPPIATATPGFHNPGEGFVDADDSDRDLDGRNRLLELATGTDPDNADVPPVLRAGIHSESGSNFPTFSYPRIPGGSIDSGGDYVSGDIRYTVQSSMDLKSWTPIATIFVGVESTGQVEIVTVRSDQPLPTSGGQGFLRLFVTRQ